MNTFDFQEEHVRNPDPVRRERLIYNDYQPPLGYNTENEMRMALEQSRLEQEEKENQQYFEEINNMMTERINSLKIIREKIQRVADYDSSIRELYIFLDSIFSDYEQLQYVFCQIGEPETYQNLISITKKIRFTEPEKSTILSIIRL